MRFILCSIFDGQNCSGHVNNTLVMHLFLILSVAVPNRAIKASFLSDISSWFNFLCGSF